MLKPAEIGKKMILSSAAAGMAVSYPLAANAYADPGPGVPTPKKENVDTTLKLRSGSHGKAVKKLQNKLQEINYYDAPVDGIYGPHTQSAVIRYQLSEGLRVDGIAGPKTLSSAFAVEGQYVPSNKTLSAGDQGQDVRVVQSELKSLGYYQDDVDGVYGLMTKDAVKHFQSANDLKIDGIVGKQTRGMLFHIDADGKTAVKKEHVSSGNNGVINDAKRLMGVEYQWGGTSTNGFDCSGFIQHVFDENGINIPRTTSEQWNYSVPVDNPQIGDLVFFETYKPGPSHVGIYLEGDRFIHVSSSKGVTITSMEKEYWATRYLGAARVVQN